MPLPPLPPWGMRRPDQRPACSGLFSYRCNPLLTLFPSHGSWFSGLLGQLKSLPRKCENLQRQTGMEWRSGGRLSSFCWDPWALCVPPLPSASSQNYVCALTPLILSAFSLDDSNKNLESWVIEKIKFFNWFLFLFLYLLKSWLQTWALVDWQI
jgi:hypothetical protein